MQKILFVTYQFPPRGGPGVQRSLNFVKHLRENGYDPIVLTVNESDIKNGGCLWDDSLLKQLPSDIEIVGTPSFEPIRLIKFLMKLRLYRFAWFFFYRFFWEWSARWPYKVYDTAEKIIKKNDIKLVYTSSSPFSSMILGKLLKERMGVKWIADLRDPFTDAYAWNFPSKLHWYLSRSFEKKYFSLPDKLIVNTPEVKKLYHERNLIDEKKIICVTNGY